MLTDGSRIFLEANEAEAIKNALLEGKKWLEIKGGVVNTFNVSRLVGGADYEEVEKIKRGEWKCKCGNWIPKGMKCGYCN